MTTNQQHYIATILSRKGGMQYEAALDLVMENDNLLGFVYQAGYDDGYECGYSIAEQDYYADI